MNRPPSQGAFMQLLSTEPWETADVRATRLASTPSRSMRLLRVAKLVLERKAREAAEQQRELTRVEKMVALAKRTKARRAKSGG
jgi:hypothetical protein